MIPGTHQEYIYRYICMYPYLPKDLYHEIGIDDLHVACKLANTVHYSADYL